MQCRSIELRVNAAAVTILALIRFPGVFRLAQCHDTVRLRRIDRRSSHLRRKKAGRAQANVADDLRVKAQPRLPGEQPVVRVDVAQIGPRLRRLPVNCAGKDDCRFGDQRFAGRAVFRPLARKPVQQLDARVGLPCVPKSFSVPTIPAEILPDAIDTHGGQRIVVATIQRQVKSV